MPDNATELLARPAGDGAGTPAETAGPAQEEIVADDQLVEEISIDGMCGVY